MKAVRRFVVRGRVQGVGFRWFVLKRARALGLQGWVRNCPDGSVEVLAAGDETSVSALEADLGRGPSGSHVENVEKSDSSDQVDVDNPFEIR